MSYEITFSVPYEEPRPESEDLELSSPSSGISGLSSFLALAIRLDVPILTASVSNERWGRSTLGAGTSFHVGRSYSSRKRLYLNPNSTINGKLGGLGEHFRSSGVLVSKRLCRNLQHDDHRCLAPLVQELRILSHSTLQNEQKIVRMLGLDWSDDSTDVVGERCWPSLLLECATHGTLGQYLLQAQRLSYDIKWMLCLNIAEGLRVLHEHGVVHCDLKLDNILVFENPVSQFPEAHVVAKISDFGFSFITSDYDQEAVFHGQAGTPPWNAPELAFGRCPRVHALEKADIYTMGLIICAIMLKGRAFWEATSVSRIQNLKETNDDAAVVDVLAISLSKVLRQQVDWISEIIHQTVKSDPSERCTAESLSMQMSLAFLEHILDGEETTPADAQIKRQKVRAVVTLCNKRHPAMQLPNIFSIEFKDDVFHPFTGVPNFEDSASFKPILLSASALREVTSDLARRADGLRGDTARAIAEAEYQLCICHIEGYGVERSVPRGLGYLARAFRNRSPQALRVARNFYDVFQHDLPSDMASAEEAGLFVGAIAELYAPDSLYNMFIATKMLEQRYPASYQAWIHSNLFINLRLQQLEYRAGMVAALADGLGVQQMVGAMRGLKIDATRTLGTEYLSALHHAAALGDLGAVSSLVLTNQDVNAAAPDLGWTPLWMACAGGYIDVAGVLLARGANLRCRETVTGRGILHLLRSFRESAAIESVVSESQGAGLVIDDLDSRGFTPLLATFDGWDHSAGAAARVLLQQGADPFVKNHDGLHAFAACVDTLDPDLVREMLACPARRKVSEQVVWEAMAAGIRAVIRQSPVYHISLLGQRGEAVIKDLLAQLLSSESTRHFLKQDETRGQSPLTTAVGLNRQTLALWLMQIRPQDVDLRVGASHTALQWAIELKRGWLVEQLLEHGVDPLIEDDMGYNALHVAAVWMPSVMITVANAIVRRNCGGDPEDAKTWLDRKDSRGYTPFGLAVFEGSQEHLDNAETLRRMYQLDCNFWIDGLQATLLGTIVHIGAIHDIANLAQVKYLLGLSPKLQFVVNIDGSTLLHNAVAGWKNAAYSDGIVAYKVLEFLLNHFPEQEHIEARDNLGATPIMTAASYANHIAIRKLRDHAAAHSLSLDVNNTEVGGATALDLVGRHALIFALGGKPTEAAQLEAAQSTFSERAGELDPGTQRLIMKNVHLTKMILMQMGAVSTEQASGITMFALITPPISVSHERQVRFLEAMKEANAGLNYDLPKGSGSHMCLECTWRISSFFLSIQMFSSLIDAKAHATEHIRAGRIHLDSWTADYGSEPWAVTKYGSGDTMWERPGQVWGILELMQLRLRVESAWDKLTGCESLNVVVFD